MGVLLVLALLMPVAAFGGSALTGPMSNEEVESCLFFHEKVAAIKNCSESFATNHVRTPEINNRIETRFNTQGNAQCNSVHEKYFQGTTALQPPVSFVANFDKEGMSWRQYFSNVGGTLSDKFWENPILFPVKLVVSYGSWIILNAAAGVYCQACIPVAELAAWAISAAVWGPDGADIFSPCRSIEPNSGPAELQKCMGEIKKRLDGKTISEHFLNLLNNARQVENALPMRFSCAVLEKAAKGFDQEVGSVSCDQFRDLTVQDLKFRVGNDGAIRNKVGPLIEIKNTLGPEGQSVTIQTGRLPVSLQSTEQRIFTLWPRLGVVAQQCGR